MKIQPIVFEIFQLGTKWWTGQQAEPVWASYIANIEKNKHVTSVWWGLCPWDLVTLCQNVLKMTVLGHSMLKFLITCQLTHRVHLYRYICKKLKSVGILASSFLDTACVYIQQTHLFRDSQLKILVWGIFILHCVLKINVEHRVGERLCFDFDSSPCAVPAGGAILHKSYIIYPWAEKGNFWGVLSATKYQLQVQVLSSGEDRFNI